MKSKGPKLYKKGKTSGVIAEKDFKFVSNDPDVDFDPDHNRRVVEMTIKKTDEKIARDKREYREKVEERVDAATHFLKALSKGKYAGVDSNTQAVRYFGKKELKRLRGEQIKEKLMRDMGIPTKLIN